MAAVTVTNRGRRAVFGDTVMYNFTCSIASSGDTLTVPGIKTIKGIAITPTTAAAVGATLANNVITFVTGGALTVHVDVIGRD